MSLSIFLVVCLASGALSSSLFAPCKVSDIACIEATVKTALPLVLSGIPELGVESSDPLFIDSIEGNLPTLKYAIFNSTIVGFKSCTFLNLMINNDITAVHCEMECKKFEINGQYELKGTLITLPVEGKGPFTYDSGNFLVSIDAEVDKVKGSDGKTHALLKNFKADPKPLSPPSFDFQNLFNGQEDLASAFRTFTQEHWREVIEFVQTPIWTAVLGKAIDNINKCLGSVPLEETLLM